VPARTLGVDLGERRIGLAVSDPAGRVATPRGMIERSRDRATDHRSVLAVAREAGAGRIVVGLPVTLRGQSGRAAREVEAEVEALRTAARDDDGGAMADEVEIVVHDERLTTVIAERSLREAGVRGRARRQRVDAAAATVMLQSYLDARGHAASAP